MYHILKYIYGRNGHTCKDKVLDRRTDSRNYIKQNNTPYQVKLK